MWKGIKENKDLDLPTHKVMVATVWCEEIGDEKLISLKNNDGLKLKDAAQSGLVSKFGKQLNSILRKCLSEYESDDVYFDEGVRTSKRKHMESKLLDVIHPAYQSQMSYLHATTLDTLKVDFDKALLAGEAFVVAAHGYSQSSLSQFEGSVKGLMHESEYVRVRICCSYEKKIFKALVDHVKAYLDDVADNTWPAIRNLLQQECESSTSEYSSELSVFDSDQSTMDSMLSNLKDYARKVVESKVKEEACRVLVSMKDRFATIFNCDSELMPRVWIGKEDIREITKTARSASVKLCLSWMKFVWIILRIQLTILWLSLS